jgi:hypothetical protein
MPLAHVLCKSTQHDNVNKSCSVAFLSMSFPFLNKFIMLVRGQQVELLAHVLCESAQLKSWPIALLSMPFFTFCISSSCLTGQQVKLIARLLCKSAHQDSVNKKN